MADNWGPWLDHNGHGCPCRGQYVRMQFERIALHPNGKESDEAEGIAGEHGGDSWDWTKPGCNIIRYRIRKPRGMVVLERLTANLPEKVDA